MLNPGDLGTFVCSSFASRSGSSVHDDTEEWFNVDTTVFVAAVTHREFAQRHTFVHFIFEGVVYVAPLENFKKL